MDVPAELLAVDDSQGVRALLVSTLSPAGYQVRQAQNGDLALSAVAAHPPDLILPSLRMKGLNGLQVCRRLKAAEATRHIPIILICAASDVQERVAGLRLGVDDCPTKPVSASTLLRVVREVLDGRPHGCA